MDGKKLGKRMDKHTYATLTFPPSPQHPRSEPSSGRAKDYSLKGTQTSSLYIDGLTPRIKQLAIILELMTFCSLSHSHISQKQHIIHGAHYTMFQLRSVQCVYSKCQAFSSRQALMWTLAVKSPLQHVTFGSPFQ